MTNEELDRLWFEAMHQSIEANEDFVRYRFAALVAAAEREACANYVAEQYGWDELDAVSLADEIRARGKT